MSQETWTSVDRYLADLLLPPDPALDAALASSAAAGLPPIQVSALQGRLLHLFARMVGARKVLEIGTLGGYSTIWLARALSSDGTLVSLELEARHAEVARGNLERAGLDSLVEVRVGPAARSLRAMIDEGVEPFDFVFIDADKEGYPEYLDLTLALSCPGTVIVADNVVRQGEIVNPANSEERVRGLRTFLERASADRRLNGTAVQTVGTKGYDGFAIFLVSGA